MYTIEERIMLEDFLGQHESKTLEFKENASNTMKIIKTVIAFANTAGGVIIIGVRDKTKEIIGVENVLQEEERLSNQIVAMISPMLIPDIDVLSKDGKELLIINVPYLAGPFYLKNSKLANGTYIRFGSTNRLADPEVLANLQRAVKRTSFDELPCMSAGLEELDSSLIQKSLKQLFKNFSDKNYESLGLIKQHRQKKYATYGGLLLFGIDKTKWLPDAIVKCVCFASTEKSNIIDKQEIKTNLIDTVEEAVAFIHRNTRVSAQIGTVRRIDIPEYPAEAIREAVINAIAHADYSIKGASVQISIFRDRIEIINPGNLTFGQTMESALSGISKMRNPVIGRIFREMGIIETLGIGMLSIIKSYQNSPAISPKFEEIENFFKVTLYVRDMPQLVDKPWAKQLQDILLHNKKVSTKEMAEVWGVALRTARDRLNMLVKTGYLIRNAHSITDPRSTYSRK